MIRLEPKLINFLLHDSHFILHFLFCTANSLFFIYYCYLVGLHCTHSLYGINNWEKRTLKKSINIVRYLRCNNTNYVHNVFFITFFRFYCYDGTVQCVHKCLKIGFVVFSVLLLFTGPKVANCSKEKYKTINFAEFCHLEFDRFDLLEKCFCCTIKIHFCSLHSERAVDVHLTALNGFLF